MTISATITTTITINERTLYAIVLVAKAIIVMMGQ